MRVYFSVYLKDRETGGYLRLCPLVETNDIEQTKIDLMLEHSDPDWECVRVRFDSIEIFTDRE